MAPSLVSGWLAPLGEAVVRVSPAQACQASFAVLGAGIVALTLLPAATQKHLLDYGARDTKSIQKTDGSDGGSKAKAEPEPGSLERLVAAIVARCQVPHTWFVGFYAFYLVCSLFWAAQWWSWRREDVAGGVPDNLFGRIVARQQIADVASTSTSAPAPSMALAQVYAAFGLEALQTGRRLYEHIYVLKPSKSKMNIAHFALGFVYYAVMSVAVWVEGSQAIATTKEHHVPSSVSTFALQSESWAKIGVGAPLFLLAWLGQYRCHIHLASLKKYSLPEEGLFRYLVSPHYTCEFFLYIALSIVTAPAGRLVNRTVLSSEIFVLAGLGVTANRTKQWYSDKFGAERVAGKWIMIPFIF